MASEPSECQVGIPDTMTGQKQKAGPAHEAPGGDSEARGRNKRQWWPKDSANEMGCLGGGTESSRQYQTSFPEKILPGQLPSDSSPGTPSPPQVGRLSQILSRAPVAIPSFPPSLPGSPAWPQVAAQSPPPTQPRERTAGTEFNRRHQQPPGKPRKVDTLIPVPVSGEQAQGRSLFLLGEGCWGPTPQWARPLPGRCHGDGPYRKQPGSFQKARQLWAPEGMGC